MTTTIDHSGEVHESDRVQNLKAIAIIQIPDVS